MCNVKACKAACCGFAPIPADLYERRKYLIQRKVAMIQELPGKHVIAVDKNGVCAFLTCEYTCAIYDERPEICRRFGEPNETHPFLKCPEKAISATK